MTAPSTPRPGLDPAVATVRRAVRAALAPLAATAAPAPNATAAPAPNAGAAPAPPAAPTVVVALSGGADSLALAAAVAFEAPKLGVRAVSVTVDHGLQEDSAATAERAAEQAAALGIGARVARAPVPVDSALGVEGAARAARYRALAEAARDEHADAVLVAHTLDDQAETVLLGLARGSGAASLQGMAPDVVNAGLRVIRPLLALTREITRAACTAESLVPWDDPHNDEARFARVRVRQVVLPVLEREIGPGIAEALARTAEQLREDSEAFAQMVDETIEEIVEPAEAGIAVSVAALAANPAALRHRIIRHVVHSEFGESLTRAQTLEVARLATHWRGQGPVDLPGCVARREGPLVVVTARA